MWLRQLSTVVTLLFLAAAARAQTSDLKQSFTCPDPAKRTRLDVHGDPLPEGAVARLGTVRLRHGYLHSGLAFSADGKSIIASDYYGGVHVWDAADGREIRQFCESDYYCHGLAVSSDGRTLAVALGNLTVRLFDPSSGRELGSLPKDREHLDHIVFSNDGTLLATSGGNWPVRVYDVATQKLVHRVQFPDYVSSLAFSPDGKVLIGGGRKGVSLRDVGRGDEIRRLKIDSESGTSLYSAVARQAGTIAVWGYDDASVRVFDANGEKELRRFHPDDGPAKKSPDAWGWGIRITARFSPDGKTLAISRGPSRIDLWDTASGKKLHSLAADTANRASHLAFSPDGTKLASTGSDNWGGDNTVRVWDVVNGKELQPRDGHGSPISSITMSPTGDTVATAGRDGAVHLWEGRSGKHLARLDGHGGRWPHASFSTDGLRLITWGGYGSEGALRIWSSIGKALGRHTLPDANAYWEAVSADGNTAASVTSKLVQFHDLATGKVTREFPDGHHRPIALSPTGDQLVGHYGTLINVADNKTLMELRGVYTHSNSVRFSEDGRTLVAAMIPQGPEKSAVSNPPAEEVAVFDPIAGRELRRFGLLGEKYRAIHAIALSRDGKMIATVRSSENKPSEQVITLWETETGAERGHFVGHRGKTHALAISADGRLVVSGGDDTAAIVWDATQPRTHDTSVRRAATTADLGARFKHLTGEHAELAYASMWAFIQAPKEAVRFLADQTSLFEATDVQKIHKWIEDLDSGKYAERERASQELALVLDESEEHLKKARLTASSAEARSRIDLLLQGKRTGFTGKKLQTFRVIEILERIGTPETEAPTQRTAAAMLKKLAAGPAEARMTREAMASVGRIERRAAMGR